VRRSSCRRVLLGLGLWMVSLVLGVRPATAQGVGEGLVLALYHASYDFGSWVPQLCDQPTRPYDSSSWDTIDQHIEQAQAAGIDVFVQAWYGPEPMQNPTQANLRSLLDRARAVNFEVAALVDMTGAFLNSADEVEAALIALRTHTAHSAYLKVNGRPVVFFLGQVPRLPMPQWKALRARVDPEARMIWIAQGDASALIPTSDLLEVFDGIYLYDLARSSTIGALLQTTSGQVREWNSAHSASVYWVATVIPGYDDSALTEAMTRLPARSRSEAYYRQNWNAAVVTEPAWILVRSFNEWRACTHIQASRDHGSRYLELTAELVEMYRESLLPPTPTPTVEPTATAETFTATPEPTPVETSTLTATATLEPLDTETPVPTLTLTPSATPPRLPTPTPTSSLAPGETRSPGSAATVAPGAVEPSTGNLPGDRSIATPVARLPVEGAARRRRCSLLPLLVPVAVLLPSRRRRMG
jgi:hypothetical protein